MEAGDGKAKRQRFSKDFKAGAVRLVLGEDYFIEKLLGPGADVGTILCIVSKARRAANAIAVDYAIARVDAFSGNVVVLDDSVGPRW